jgi:hypothetical protein
MRLFDAAHREFAATGAGFIFMEGTRRQPCGRPEKRHVLSQKTTAPAVVRQSAEPCPGKHTYRERE